MSFKSLVAHNGVSHQKSSSEHKAKPLISETKTDRESNIDPQNITPENNVTSDRQPIEIIETNTNTKNKSETLATQVTPDLTTATLVPGFGESIFTLLIASPFLLFGFKKWLHR